MKVTGEMQGLKEIQKLIKTEPVKAVKRSTRTSVFRAAQKLRDLLKQRITAIGAVDTGQTRAAIKARRSRGGQGFEQAKVGLGDRSYIARWIEFGFTMRNKQRKEGRPFIRPTLFENKDELIQIVAEEIKKELAKLKGLK